MSAVLSSPEYDASNAVNLNDVHAFILDSGVGPSAAGVVGGLNIVERQTFVPTETEFDVNGHGTAVASVLAGKHETAGETLLLGPAPGVQIHGYKVLNYFGRGPTSGIVAAMDRVYFFKTQFPALPCVVNCSFSGGPTVAMMDATASVLALGCIVIASAGNLSMDMADTSPANIPGVIAVGAFDHATNGYSTFSNYGYLVDILAPGTNVQVKTLSNQLTLANGTSFSSPIVSGLACIVVGRNPTWNCQQVRDYLCNNAQALLNTCFGRPPVSGVQYGTTALGAIMPPLGTLAREQFLISDASGALGHTLYSPNRQYRLTMQSDANLVVYRVSDGAVMWAANWTDTWGYNPIVNPGAGPFKLTMTGAGGLVIGNAGGNVLWDNREVGVLMRLTDDGRMEVYSSSGTCVFMRPTPTGQPPALTSNSTVIDGQTVTAFASGSYNSTYHPWKAFDGGLTSSWMIGDNCYNATTGVVVGTASLAGDGYLGHWVGFTLPYAVSPVSYELSGNMQSFRLYGQEAGSSIWSVLDQVNNLSITGSTSRTLLPSSQARRCAKFALAINNVTPNVFGRAQCQTLRILATVPS